jgi:hypothetical protein
MRIDVGPEVTVLTGETDGILAVLNCAIKGAEQLHDEVSDIDVKRESRRLAEMCRYLVAEMEAQEEQRAREANLVSGHSMKQGTQLSMFPN